VTRSSRKQYTNNVKLFITSNISKGSVQCVKFKGLVAYQLTSAPPSEEWVFLPPTVSAPSSKSPPTPSHLPTPTPIIPDDDDVSGAYGPIQLFAAEYFSTALGMPFEVGKTLLQIEYRPRKRFDTTPEEAKVVFEAEEDEVSTQNRFELMIDWVVGES